MTTNPPTFFRPAEPEPYRLTYFSAHISPTCQNICGMPRFHELPAVTKDLHFPDNSLPKFIRTTDSEP